MAMASSRAQLIVDRLLQEFSPRRIAAYSFGMDNPDERLRLVTKLDKHRKRHKIDDYNGLEIFKSGDVIYAKGQRGLVYFVQFQDEKYRALPGRHVTQIAVWSQYGNPPGLARYVFWTHLFPIYGTMMTDSMQTEKGEGFWGHVLAEAFAKNLYVYRVNLVHLEITPIKDDGQLTALKPLLYGDHKRNENERIVITDKPF